MKYKVILPLVLFFLVSITSCATPSKSDSKSAPVQSSTPMFVQTPPAESWVSDGIIKEGEYAGANDYGNFVVNWRSDEQFIYLGMKAKTRGWLAMAIQPGARMKDADMIIGFITDGKPEVQDQFSTGDFGPHKKDIELDGRDNILAYGGNEEGEFTTIEFKRALATGDKYDIPITKGVNQIIWAYGSSDDLSAKHTARGYGEINPQ